MLAATNRTNLELKQMEYLLFQIVRFLPIAPIWNWNSEILPSNIWDTNYQSHQSGIETLNSSYKDWKPCTTNRTNLELKPNS